MGVFQQVGTGLDVFGIGSGEENRTTTGQQQNVSTTKTDLAPITSDDVHYGNLVRTGIDKGTQIADTNYNNAAQAYSQVARQFRDALIKFSTGSLQPTPEQYAQSTDFVDKTFTQPAQTQYTKFLSQAQEATSNRAATLGRTSLDTAINNQFLGAANEAAKGIADQRASLIAQRADELSYNRPAQQLTALGQGAQFFNQPLQSAINNRLQMLNAATQQQQFAFNSRLAQGTTTNTNKSSGSTTLPEATLGNRVAAYGQAADNGFKTFLQAYSTLYGGGMGGMMSGGGNGQSSSGNYNGASGPSMGNFQLNTSYSSPYRSQF